MKEKQPLTLAESNKQNQEKADAKAIALGKAVIAYMENQDKITDTHYEVTKAVADVLDTEIIDGLPGVPEDVKQEIKKQILDRKSKTFGDLKVGDDIYWISLYNVNKLKKSTIIDINSTFEDHDGWSDITLKEDPDCPFPIKTNDHISVEHTISDGIIFFADKLAITNWIKNLTSQINNL